MTRIEWLQNQKPSALRAEELYEFYDDYVAMYGEISMETYKRYTREAINLSNPAPIAKDDVQITKEEDNVKYSTVIETRSVSIRTLEELLEYAEIDTDVWMVSKSTVNRWGKAEDFQYQVKAWLTRRAPDDITPEMYAERFKDLIKSYKPPQATKPLSKDTLGDKLVEIAIFDHHFGQLSWGEETGKGNYDIKIAAKIMDDAIDYFIGKTSPEVGKWLVPVGNDFFNADNHLNTTFAGTPQVEDGRWAKTFLKAEELWVRQIDKLLAHAPVDVVIVPGNHDRSRIYYFGEFLRAWYKDNPNVTIENSPKKHKTYEFGETMILFTHGDNLQAKALPMLMVTENPTMYSSTTYHEIQKGHWHAADEKRHQIMKETAGIREIVLPSLVDLDDYHAGKGYQHLRESVAFVYDYMKGREATFYFHP